MTFPPRPIACECLDPFHDGKPCVREPADHGEVVASPALCLPCLFGCEDYNGRCQQPKEITNDHNA